MQLDAGLLLQVADDAEEFACFRIAAEMPMRLDAEREHYLEGFRRAGLD
jgi:hypothetical protein